MGMLRGFISEVFSKGLRNMNAEINEQAVAEGLIAPNWDAGEDAPAGLPCRAGFETLYTQLVSPNRDGGPA